MSSTFSVLSSNLIHLFLLLDVLRELVMDLVRAPRHDVRIKDHIDFFEGTTAGLRVHEEDVECHCEAEYTKNYVCLPLDVVECRGNEVGQCKVEDPISRGGHTNTLGTILEGEDF